MKWKETMGKIKEAINYTRNLLAVAAFGLIDALCEHDTWLWVLAALLIAGFVAVWMRQCCTVRFG